ncbi:MAG: RNA 2',3'-cyclic phosphodiesterase [Burkholderiaceae bacterium]|nr:RNA 2',3'-cyclic phosphodiesterase [Burkholderiaceae bacterium]
MAEAAVDAPGAAGTPWRVFVALWPPEPVRCELARLGRRLQERAPRARLVPSERLHLTLAFIGALAPASALALARALRCLDAEPFDWPLDRIGHFARARVVWAGGEPIEPLLACAERVRGLLQRVEVPFDRRPFVPHVTLLRNVARWHHDARHERIDTIVWRCERPLLVRSEATGHCTRYIPIGHVL